MWTNPQKKFAKIDQVACILTSYHLRLAITGGSHLQRPPAPGAEGPPGVLGAPPVEGAPESGQIQNSNGSQKAVELEFKLNLYFGGVRLF